MASGEFATERAGGVAPAPLLPAAWSRTCLHCDGIAIGPVVYALRYCGLLRELAAAAEPLCVDELAERYQLKRGYLHLAMRLLAAQGLVRRAGDLARGRTTVELTEDGRAWHPLADAYDAVPFVLQHAMTLLSRADVPPTTTLYSQGLLPNGDVSGMADRICRHLRGPLVAAAMTLLDRCRAFRMLRARPGVAIPIADLPCDPLRAEAALIVLAIEGWAEIVGGSVTLTSQGLAAAQLAPQYFYPASYLPTFAAVPDLLFGRSRPPENKTGEQHLDRELDIAFSGEVFRRSCRDPFLAMALPIFTRMPIEAQPKYIIDTGCGDGTLLIELFEAIRIRSPRGERLADHPLLLVGVDYNRLSRDVAERRLREAALLHLVAPGDIGDPDGIAATLAAHGIDMRQALHVSKSVIHNRSFRPPRRPRTHSFSGVDSTAVFVAPGGGLIDMQDMLGNLVEHFEAWRPWVGGCGMIVIEAHTVDPALVADHLGTALNTVIDAAHGFSHQYLVEVEIHRAAAAAAGFVARDRRDLGAWMAGRSTLSIDHLCLGVS